MIRINLLNQKIKTQANPQLTTIAVSADVVMTRDEIQKQALLRIATILVFPVLFFVYDNYYFQVEANAQFPPVEAKIAELRKFNEAKEKFVNDIKQFEKEGKVIQDKINKINFLDALRGYEIEIHKFFQKTLPEKLWFDEMTYTFDQKTETGIQGEIRIRGMSYTSVDVQLLRKAIKENILFTECEIQKSTQVDFEGQKVENFELLVKMEKKL